MTAAYSVAFDADLMRRHDREGPRYTSYPTALQFREGIDESTYERAARSSRGALRGEPVSLYVHLPFCFSPCFYCGCNKVVTRELGRTDEYVRQLLREITLRGRYFAPDRLVEQMHFGGGTPTYLPKKRLIELIDRLDLQFRLTDVPSRDYSIEIDPRAADRSLLQLLTELGFNRISLGVQDFDEDVQSAVNRLQPEATVRQVYDAARDLGLRSINFDLIYGLPRQTLSTFARTLDRVVEMRPDRVAVYGYAHMPRIFKAQRQINVAELPNAAARLELLRLAVDKLGAAGYVYIGMDHFALPDDSLAKAQREGTLQRSFQGYTTHASRDLINLGVSAIGQVGNLYVQSPKSLADYSAALAEGMLPAHRGVAMTAEDALRKDVIHSIMCYGRIDFAAIETRHGVQFDAFFGSEIERLHALQREGLVELAPGRVQITPVGRLLMRSIAMVFDAYLAASAPSASMSRVI